MTATGSGLAESVWRLMKTAGPGDVERLRAIADESGWFGRAWLTAGHVDGATPPLRDTVEVRRLLARLDSRHDADLALALTNLGLCLMLSGTTFEAQPLADETATARYLATAVAVDVATTPPDLFVWPSRPLDEAREVLAEAVSIRRAMVVANRERELDLADALVDLSLCLVAMGRPRQAIAPGKEALRILRPRADSGTPDELRRLAAVLNCLWLTHITLGTTKVALAVAKLSVSVLRQLVEARPDRHIDDLATALSRLATVHTELGDHAAAAAATAEAAGLVLR